MTAVVDAGGAAAGVLDDPHVAKNLFQAILLEQHDRVDELLDPTTNDFILHLKQTDELLRTPLYFAAQYGKTELVSRFIATAAVDIDAADHHGWTPLFIACLNGHLEVGQLLVEHAATIEHIENEYGWTPIYAAVANNHIDMLRFLIKHKANVNVSDKLGRSPLWLAASLGNTDLVEELLANTSVDINAVDKSGRSPLYIAVQSGHLETLIVLVESKCNLALADVDGRTPLALAESLGHAKIEDYLLKNNAPHDFEDSQTNETLHEFSGEFISQISTPSGVKILCLAEEGSRMWGGGSDGTLFVWETLTGKLLCMKEKAHGGLIHQIVIEGTKVWVLSEDDDLSVWKFYRGDTLNAPDVKKIKKLQCSSRLHCLCKSKQKIWAGSTAGVVYSWTLKKDYPCKRITFEVASDSTSDSGGSPSNIEADDIISQLVCSETMLFAVVKNTVFAFDMKILSGPFSQHALRHRLTAHSDQVNDLVFEDPILYTVSKDATMKAWDLDEDKLTSSQENPAKVYVTKFIALGSDRFLSCGFEKVVRIWDSKLELIETIQLDEHHSREIATMFWSGNSGRLWLSSLDKSVSLWK
eukprot:TRINITY_DN10768_c0_g1_i1.p1 TRINITY_DN10768_c0_g1~~TRINITY_DN10768_c0_g1_i1.p1  ORF type:complete len:613 (+),score=129.71 TRINITY_DN10768_c0_g1_i1:89-1840(+)